MTAERRFFYGKNMASYKTFELAFILGAQISSGFNQSMTAAQKSLSRYEKAVKAAEQASAEVKGSIARRRATDEAKKSWIEASQKAQGLARAMSQVSVPTKKMINELNAAREASRKAKQSWLEQKNALSQYERSVKTAGMSVQSLYQNEKKLAEQQKKAQALAQRSAKYKATMHGGWETVKNNGAYAGALGASGTAALTGVVGTGAGFDSAMARVGAVSGATGEDLLALREQAKELGKSTVWSSSQAAEGQQYLAMAGFSKDQILKSMPGMLDLASAGGIDLGSAADIGSNILTGMGLDASEMGRVGDVLTNTFTKSNTNLSMLGETMKFAAPVAKSLGVSLEEAAAMAGKLGDAGIQGSMAGTTLRAVMLRLSAPSSQGAKALDALGVKTTDAAGNMRKMPDILADLNKAMAKMTDSQRSAYTKAIFDTEAMSGAFVLMEQAGKGALQDFIASVKKSGTAKEVAAKQNDNLMGDYKAMTSALEGLSITIYESIAPALRTLTQAATSVLTWFTDFAKENSTLVSILTGVVGAFGAVAASIIPVITVVKTGAFVFGLFRSLAGAAQLAFMALGGPMTGIIAIIMGICVAGYALYKNWDLVKEKLAGAWEYISQIFSGLGETIKNAFQTAIAAVVEPINNLENMITNAGNVIVTGFQNAFSGMSSFIGGAFENAMGVAKAPINAMIAMINSVIGKINEYSNVQVPSWVPGFGGESLGFQLNPIPALASGGVATRSTIAQIGEGSEPEAVLPLSRLNAMLSPQPAAPSVHVNLNISVNGSGNPGADIQQAASAAAFNLKRELERLLADERRLAY